MISQDANVTVLIADYVGVDASSKINAIGAGFAVAGIDNGFTAPQHIAVLIDVPGRYHTSTFSVGLELRDEASNTVVQIPGPTGVAEAMRIQQLVKAERPSIPGVWLPDDMYCRVQFVLNFPNGLPLQVGKRYIWRVEVDGNHRRDWVARFYVPGSAPGPVFGGQTGPADIPPGVVPPSEPT